MWLPLPRALTGDQTSNPDVCLSGNRTADPLLCGTPSPPSHTGQGDTAHIGDHPLPRHGLLFLHTEDPAQRPRCVWTDGEGGVFPALLSPYPSCAVLTLLGLLGQHLLLGWVASSPSSGVLEQGHRPFPLAAESVRPDGPMGGPSHRVGPLNSSTTGVWNSTILTGAVLGAPWASPTRHWGHALPLRQPASGGAESPLR